MRAGAALEETLPGHHAAQVPAPTLVGRASGSDSQNLMNFWINFELTSLGKYQYQIR